MKKPTLAALLLALGAFAFAPRAEARVVEIITPANGKEVNGDQFIVVSKVSDYAPGQNLKVTVQAEDVTGQIVVNRVIHVVTDKKSSASTASPGYPEVEILNLQPGQGVGTNFTVVTKVSGFPSGETLKFTIQVEDPQGYIFMVIQVNTR